MYIFSLCIEMNHKIKCLTLFSCYLFGDPKFRFYKFIGCVVYKKVFILQYLIILQGGANMTGTNCDLFTHKSSRSYLDHLV
jgi:hypothetical protein